MYILYIHTHHPEKNGTHQEGIAFFLDRKVLSCRRSGQTSRVSSGPLGLRKGGDPRGDPPHVLQLSTFRVTVDDMTGLCPGHVALEPGYKVMFQRKKRISLKRLDYVDLNSLNEN